MTQNTNNTTGEGNTINLSGARSRKWVFTINNWDEKDEAELNKLMNVKQWQIVYGKEVGESGTPHLQGYIYHKNAIAFKTLKNIFPRGHFEKARGTTEQNLAYCSKDGDFQTNIKQRRKPKDPLEGKELRPFQQEIVNGIQIPMDDRTIHWYYDETGNTGKTTLAKHLCLQFPNQVLFCTGKASDIKYGVTSFLDNEENDLKVCIFHFTRSVENFVSYEAIESIKDGIFYNTKYESKMVIFDSPHVICLANFEPNEEKLSRDRWNIKKIN